MYSITLYPNHQQKVINTDSYLPILADTGQPVFITDKK